MPAMEPEVVMQKKDEALGVLSKSSRLLGDSGVGPQVPSAADGEYDRGTERNDFNLSLANPPYPRDPPWWDPPDGTHFKGTITSTLHVQRFCLLSQVLWRISLLCLWCSYSLWF